MKKTLILFALTSLLYFPVNLIAQVQSWESINSYPDARSGAVSFVIGNTAYVGTGLSDGGTYHNNFYKYDGNSNNWVPISDLPGVPRSNAVAFVANGKGYVGSGSDANNQYKDFYEYDPVVGAWNAISDLPGEARRSATSFSINDKGYVGLGGSSSGSLSDFYEYDPANNIWNVIADLGTDQKRSRAVGFSANGKGYITSGTDGSFVYSGMRSYDPSTDTWTEEIFADSKLSSLQQNTVYIDDQGLVHILKSGFTQQKVMINLSDNSLELGDFYFEDKRNGSVAFYLRGQAYAGTGAVYDSFGAATYQDSFRKLVTFTPPAAPNGLRNASNSGPSIRWTDNANNEDGFIIYLSEEDNENFRLVDTLKISNITYFSFDTLKQGVRQYVKVAAYNEAGATYSAEFSFFPAYNTGKVVTPELISVAEDQTDSLSFKMIYTLVNKDGYGNVMVERSLDAINYELIVRGARVSDTVTFTHSPNFNEYSETLYYRLKMSIDGREDSDYSNVITFNTEELKPKAPEVAYTFEERSTGNYNGEYFKCSVTLSKFNHVDSISLIGMMDDSIQFTKIISKGRVNYRDVESFDLKGNDTLRLFTVNENVFGVDTVETVIVAPAFHRPSFGSHIESNTEAISIGIQSNVNNFDGFTVIERAEASPSNEFEVLDSIRPGDIYYYGDYQVVFIDDNVEPNRDYYYRLRNKNGETASYYSVGIKHVKSIKTPSWNIFRENSLELALDSLKSMWLTNVNYFDSKIFFLSAKEKHAYYFDLDTDQLMKMEDIPLPWEYNYDGNFSAVNLINNKLYCFTPDTAYHSGYLKSIFIYDLETEAWTKKDFENIGSVNYSAKIDDNSLLLGFSYSSLASLDTRTDTFYNSGLKTSNKVSYSNVMGDSIMIVDNDRKVYTVDKNLSSLNFKYKIDQMLEKEYITEYQNRLTQVSYGRISEVDLSKANPLTYVENFPFGQARKDFVFSYNDTLIYFDGLYSNALESFYFRDPQAPGQLIGLSRDSVGHESASFSWVDSPDETAYRVKLYNGYWSNTILSTDTLVQNTDSHTISGLIPDKTYRMSITPLNNELKGAEEFRYFETREAPVPSAPINITLTQLSQDSVEVSWELIDPVAAVDSLNINGRHVNSTGIKQSYLIAAFSENKKQSVLIYAFNKWEKSTVVRGDTILTHLYTPSIEEIGFNMFEDKFEIKIRRNSQFSNFFELYRKSNSEIEFKLVQTVEGVQSNEFVFEDFITDTSIPYEYYVKSYLLTNDSLVNKSFPSEIVSTENVVLSSTTLTSNDISVFPNPVTEQIHLSVHKNIVISRIEIFTVQGRLIKSFAASEVIDVSELERGIYLLKVKAGSGELIKRFIKE